MNYPPIMSQLSPLPLKVGGHVPPAPMGARPIGVQSIFLHFIDAWWLFLAFQKLLAMSQLPATSEHVNDYPELW